MIDRLLLLASACPLRTLAVSFALCALGFVADAFVASWLGIGLYAIGFLALLACVAGLIRHPD